ncbi:TPA: 50S ribosomal protein L14 [Candidatus Woesearchaeota archaeon]|nr:50S ribosomal protein L14P [archaeon GW2011_AR15]AJS11583.1 50S ribosomal protein L14P [uncultured archaeon]AJS11875.1 50S ribosomal protein L14P [uncultured archaeon]MBS3103855.1 50S ribosomal protein L14 [Candidatus Woesearchaeota archaeon]HIH40819.1 50S ribosomal protein L14 [Candidatus Woesearchaeota archaeon]
MKAVRARVTRGLPVGANVPTCDNSGAKVIELISVYGYKGVKNRKPAAGVGDIVRAAVKKGRPDMMKQMVYAIIVRQKREYRRASGIRVKFEDNAAVVLKDDKGNPKGTIFKGPIAKEATERWPAVAKVASIIL